MIRRNSSNEYGSDHLARAMFVLDPYAPAGGNRILTVDHGTEGNAVEDFL